MLCYIIKEKQIRGNFPLISPNFLCLDVKEGGTGSLGIRKKRMRRTSESASHPLSLFTVD